LYFFQFVLIFFFTFFSIFVCGAELGAVLKDKNQTIEKLETALKKQQDGEPCCYTLVLGMHRLFFLYLLHQSTFIITTYKCKQCTSHCVHL